ncbi:NAD(P)H-binding protein [soil metagenome]
MHVVIAGGHGQIALLLEHRLVHNGDEVVGLVRKVDHVTDLERIGANAAVVDLESCSVDEMAAALTGSEAVVFAAGAGPGSGGARKETVDRDGAALLADAAEQAGIRRYVLVSSMGVDEADPDSEDAFQVYLRAKKEAEEDLRARDLDWTIVRPGRLTDEPATGRVQLADSVERGDIPRDDVAAVLLAVLEAPDTSGKVLELVGGDDEVGEAVAAA